MFYLFLSISEYLDWSLASSYECLMMTINPNWWGSWNNKCNIATNFALGSFVQTELFHSHLFKLQSNSILVYKRVPGMVTILSLNRITLMGAGIVYMLIWVVLITWIIDRLNKLLILSAVITFITITHISNRSKIRLLFLNGSNLLSRAIIRPN